MREALARLASPCDVAGALQAATAALGADGRLEAELLLGELLALDRIGLLRERQLALAPAARARFHDLLARRLDGVPLAYLLGRREFWSLEFAVDARVLIPRPETEGLVELGAELAARAPAGPILDLGTGSGAVAVVLARECEARCVFAVDDSAAALEVARANAARHVAGRVAFIASDWCAAVAPASAALIVSNPPYVEDAYPGLTTAALCHEPRRALASGPDGLDAIRRIVDDGWRCLVPDGWLALEHGAGQGPAVRALLTARGYVDVATRRDLAGLERISAGRRPG